MSSTVGLWATWTLTGTWLGEWWVACCCWEARCCRAFSGTIRLALTVGGPALDENRSFIFVVVISTCRIGGGCGVGLRAGNGWTCDCFWLIGVGLVDDDSRRLPPPWLGTWKFSSWRSRWRCLFPVKKHKSLKVHSKKSSSLHNYSISQARFSAVSSYLWPRRCFDRRELYSLECASRSEHRHRCPFSNSVVEYVPNTFLSYNPDHHLHLRRHGMK